MIGRVVENECNQRVLESSLMRSSASEVACRLHFLAEPSAGKRFNCPSLAASRLHCCQHSKPRLVLIRVELLSQLGPEIFGISDVGPPPGWAPKRAGTASAPVDIPQQDNEPPPPNQPAWPSRAQRRARSFSVGSTQPRRVFASDVMLLCLHASDLSAASRCRRLPESVPGHGRASMAPVLPPRRDEELHG